MPSIAIPLSLRGQLLSGSRFEPSRLFAANEPGVWYDPSDLSTMFQDRAGTIPVTAPGQSVGLRLDKSKGLVLGPELRGTGVVGIVGTATAATYNASTGVGSVTRVDLSNQSFVQIAGLTNERSYLVNITCSSGTLAVRSGGFSGNLISNVVSGQTLSLYVVASSASLTITNTTSAGTAAFTLNSVKELPGNHAVANSDAARGVYGIEPLGGRRNLLTFTEQFDNAAWTKTSGAAVTANTNIAPDGTATADTVSDSSSIFNSVSQTSAYSSTMTATIYVRKDSVPRTTRFSLFRIAFSGGTARDAQIALDTSTGEVSSVGSTATVNSATAVDAGDYWRLTISGTDNGANTSVSLFFFPAAGASSTWVLTASVTGSAVIWGAQLETGSTATPYQRVVSQYEVTEAGKPTLHYVQYDGVDDGYVTPTITPSTDKVQVFAGVRKLSDAATGIFIEHGTNAGSNPGAFYLTAPDDAVNLFRFISRGTNTGSASSSTSFAAPTTRVISGRGDISGDKSTLRVDGTQVAQSTADQGTGNYLAYPFYIGRRGGTTLPFNGRDYGLIVRFGSNLSAETIAATETWLNSKTGAY